MKTTLATMDDPRFLEKRAKDFISFVRSSAPSDSALMEGADIIECFLRIFGEESKRKRKMRDFLD